MPLASRREMWVGGIWIEPSGRVLREEVGGRLSIRGSSSSSASSAQRVFVLDDGAIILVWNFSNLNNVIILYYVRYCVDDVISII